MCMYIIGGIMDSNMFIRRKNGFTLAEVLITLGIIGVVAAMTMPTLIASHKKTVTETQLKKAYSVLANGIKQYMHEEGVEYADSVPFAITVDNKVEMDKFFRTYFNADPIPTSRTLKIAHKNSKSTNFISGTNSSVGVNGYRLNDGTVIYVGPGVQYNESTKHSTFSDKIFGQAFDIGEMEQEAFIAFYVSLGKEDKTKISGVDFFAFYLWGNGKLSPFSRAVEEQMYKNSNDPCGIENGLYCTADIVTNGWKIKYKL